LLADDWKVVVSDGMDDPSVPENCVMIPIKIKKLEE